MNWFKRMKSGTRAIPIRERELLREVYSRISEYPELSDQVDDDNFIVGKCLNPTGGPFSYMFTLDASLESTYGDRYAPDRTDFSGVKVWDVSGNVVEVEFYIVEGMVAGYHSPVDLEKLDWCEVDVSSAELQEYTSSVSHAAHLASLALSQAGYGLHRPLELDWGDGTFFTVMSLEDGNYLAERGGVIYLLSHDPVCVAAIFASLEELDIALASGDFDPSSLV